MKTAILALAAVALTIGPALFAQTITPPASRQTIDQRKLDQQKRIARGVQSGQLTPRETGRIEHQEAGLNREERAMRAQNNGHLSAQDRSTLRAQQNQESRRIYRQKHDSQVR